MEYLTLLTSALSSGAGAFAGGLAAYYWACRRDNQIKIRNYLNLLLVIHENLSNLYQLFSDIPPEEIKEVDGEKAVVFDIPFPKINITSEQMHILFEVSPDKDMPSTLMQVQNFLTARNDRLEKSGVNILPIEEVEQYAYYLKGMLLSVKIQYEQQTKKAFPFSDSIPYTQL